MFDDLFNKLRKTNEFITKEQIYALYDQVSKEIESGMKDNGVWTKAYADARGDLQAAKGIYIELMVERYVLAGEAQREAINRSQKNKRKKELKKKIDTATESVKEFVNESITLPPPKKSTKSDKVVIVISFILYVPIIIFWLYALGWDYSEAGIFTKAVPFILALISATVVSVIAVDAFLSISKKLNKNKESFLLITGLLLLGGAAILISTVN